MNGFDSYRVRERADVARLVLTGVFVLLAGAFFRTQVIQHEKFQLRAETNRLRPISLTAPRGTIFDRNGGVIAENVPGYSVKVLAPSVDSLRAVIGRIGRFVPVDTAEIEDIVRRYRQARYQPAVVFGDATFETVARLEEHRAVLPGLLIQSEPKRLYPARRWPTSWATSPRSPSGTSRPSAIPGRTSARSWARRGSSDSTTTPSAGSRGCGTWR
jgi:penicillin-binding protein 2